LKLAEVEINVPSFPNAMISKKYRTSIDHFGILKMAEHKPERPSLLADFMFSSQVIQVESLQVLSSKQEVFKAKQEIQLKRMLN
jgi:hypothetical protein